MTGKGARMWVVLTACLALCGGCGTTSPSAGTPAPALPTATARPLGSPTTVPTDDPDQPVADCEVQAHGGVYFLHAKGQGATSVCAGHAAVSGGVAAILGRGHGVAVRCSSSDQAIDALAADVDVYSSSASADVAAAASFCRQVTG